jgi:hypothetical protein
MQDQTTDSPTNGASEAVPAQPNQLDTLIASVSTINLGGTTDIDDVEFDGSGYIEECISQLGYIDVVGSTSYEIDLGELGTHDIEIEEATLNIDLEDAVRDEWCGSVPDFSEFASTDEAGTCVSDVGSMLAAWTETQDEDNRDPRLFMLAALDAVLVHERLEARNAEATVSAGIIQALRDEQDELSRRTMHAENIVRTLRSDLSWAANNLVNTLPTGSEGLANAQRIQVYIEAGGPGEPTESTESTEGGE